VPEQPRCCERVWRACADRTAGIGYLCGFFGGSLCTSSGHRSSINSRIGSDCPLRMRSASRLGASALKLCLTDELQQLRRETIAG
jgi:hypothetical protein